MFRIVVDLERAIVPGSGLGGFALRSHITELEELVARIGCSQPGTFRLATAYEAVYSLGKGEVEIAVDVRNGKVFKLIALPGYRGRLFGQIRVGMLVREAMALDQRFYYDEVEELILCRGVPGVAMDVEAVDPPPSLVPPMPISAISVFIPEIDEL